MKKKIMNIIANESSVFWSATIVAFLAVVSAFSSLFGIALAPDFLDNLMGFLIAIVSLLVVVGILKKKEPEDEFEDEDEK